VASYRLKFNEVGGGDDRFGNVRASEFTIAYIPDDPTATQFVKTFTDVDMKICQEYDIEISSRDAADNGSGHVTVGATTTGC